MINSKILPVHILRLYLWEVLKMNTDIATINNLVPIIPINDEPELADSGKPYIIYGYAENEAEPLKQIRRGIMTLRLSVPEIAQLGEMVNVIYRAMEDEDATAESVNLWSSNNSNFEGIRFTTICVSSVDGGNAAETEGGDLEAIIQLSYRYITQHDIARPVTGGLWY